VVGRRKNSTRCIRPTNTHASATTSRSTLTTTLSSRRSHTHQSSPSCVKHTHPLRSAHPPNMLSRLAPSEPQHRPRAWVKTVRLHIRKQAANTAVAAVAPPHFCTLVPTRRAAPHPDPSRVCARAHVYAHGVQPPAGSGSRAQITNSKTVCADQNSNSTPKSRTSRRQ